MCIKTERIERNSIGFFGLNQYIQEVKRKKISTEKVEVYTHNPVEMSFDTTRQKVNIIV
jgi:hypothetical protein